MVTPKWFQKIMRHYGMKPTGIDKQDRAAVLEKIGRKGWRESFNEFKEKKDAEVRGK